MSLSIFLNILLATAATAQAPVSPDAAQFTPGAPGFADCPDGILCPIVPRQPQRQATVMDEDCEEHASAQLPVAQPATAIKTVIDCGPDVPDCPTSTPPSTVTVCPGEGCEHDSSALPVATKLPVCPPDECPECSPDVCTPCSPDEDCDICDECLPACPGHCPPPGETATSDQLVPTPATPTPTSSPPVSHSISLPPTQSTGPHPPPVAAGERPQPRPGVYLGMAAVFVAINWF